MNNKYQIQQMNNFTYENKMEKQMQNVIPKGYAKDRQLLRSSLLNPSTNLKVQFHDKESMLEF